MPTKLATPSTSLEAPNAPRSTPVKNSFMARPREASARLPDALQTPSRLSRLLNKYGAFIARNASSVSQIESALRSLTYIIPGRFRESELASESLHSAIQLLSLYHDALLSHTIGRLPSADSTSKNLSPRPTTPHNRYTQFWTQRSSLYKRLAVMLQVIRYTELLCEMAAKRRGEKARWRVVVLIESVKAICRLVLLRVTRGRMVLTTPLPEREIPGEENGDRDLGEREMEARLHDKSNLNASPAIPSSLLDSVMDDPAATWKMPRTGFTLPSPPQPSSLQSYLLSKVLTSDDIKPANALLHRVKTSRGQLAEVLFILRPVIYALAMQRWSRASYSTSATNAPGGAGTKTRSRLAAWQPFLLGLSIEYAARQLVKQDFRSKLAGGLRSLTGLEREELRRRGAGMWWWALRGAFYRDFTRPWIESLILKLRNKPVLDVIGGVIEDYEYLWDNYHFSTATL